MTPKAARPLLLARRPNGQDDAQLKDALAAAAASPELEAEARQWQASDNALSEELFAVPLGEEVTARLGAAAETLRAKRSGRVSLGNPATIAVGVGFLLLVAVLVWNFLGRAGTFPDDGVKIATTGGKAAPVQFDEVQDKTEHLPDWFMLKGFDDFRIPPGFGNFDAVGVRIFKVEDEAIAQVAVSADHPMYFYSFRAQPFGISVYPEGTWRFTEADQWSLAIREESGICFLVAMRGKKNDLKRVMESAGVR
jgi:hypothetical protein